MEGQSTKEKMVNMEDKSELVIQNWYRLVPSLFLSFPSLAHPSPKTARRKSLWSDVVGKRNQRIPVKRPPKNVEFPMVLCEFLIENFLDNWMEQRKKRDEMRLKKLKGDNGGRWGLRGVNEMKIYV